MNGNEKLKEIKQDKLKEKEQKQSAKIQKQIPPASIKKTKFQEVYAPKKFKHPLQALQGSKNLTFMIGEDEQGAYLYGEGAITSGAYKNFYNMPIITTLKELI